MNKVLFSHSYFMRFDPKQWSTGQPYPPLATIGAAALLREHGFDVSLFDTMFVASPDDVMPRLVAERPDIFVVYDDGFNYLTKMCLTNMRDAAYRMIELARQLGCVIIVSSSDSTDHYQEYLERGADHVLLGEGEQTLLERQTDQQCRLAIAHRPLGSMDSGQFQGNSRDAGTAHRCRAIRPVQADPR